MRRVCAASVVSCADDREECEGRKRMRLRRRDSKRVISEELVRTKEAYLEM